MTWLSSRELKIYLLIVGALSLIALLITLIALLPGYIRYNKSVSDTDLVLDTTIDMSKFIVPDSYKQFHEITWSHLLPDREKWSWEDIEPYWQNPKELILEYLEEQNESVIDDIFKDIP
ncbi:MAG: hypothetical protein PF693_20540 [Spirochaetia bacterium]|jgi:hypothetical protein|nr:hypothetical protein [Spirochaetia bacterium]